ncbi:MAG: hypothetical protein ABJL67_20770 [Sulfitobacter sp.]
MQMTTDVMLGVGIPIEDIYIYMYSKLREINTLRQMLAVHDVGEGVHMKRHVGVASNTAVGTCALRHKLLLGAGTSQDGAVGQALRKNPT